MGPNGELGTVGAVGGVGGGRARVYMIQVCCILSLPIFLILSAWHGLFQGMVGANHCFRADEKRSRDGVYVFDCGEVEVLTDPGVNARVLDTG